MLANLFLFAANHLLGQSGWARERLLAHAGGTARLSLGGVDILFSIEPDGYLARWISTQPPDVTLSLPADALPAAALNGMESLMKEIHIEGKADLADAIGFVFRNLRWDYEEDLSRLFGDIVAHRMVETAHVGKRFIERNAEHVVTRLIEEKQLAVPRPLYVRFAAEADDVRQRLSALERRLAALDKRKRSH